MKKTILFLSAILTTSLVFGQNTFPPTGNAGIGTTTPVGKLDINTGSSPTYNMSEQGSGIISFGNAGYISQPSIISKTTTDNASGLILFAGTSDISNLADMRFDVRKNDNNDFTTLTTTAFRFSRYSRPLVDILRNGNVLIGTTTNSLSTKLFVNGTGAFKNPTGGAGGTALSLLQVSNGSTASPASNKISWIRTDLLECGSIDVPDSRTNVNGVPMVFSTRDNSSAVSEKMRIDNGGNVGIGTTTPLTKLHIDVASSTGSSSVNGIRVATGLMGLNLGTESTNNYSWIQSTLGGVGQKNLSLNPYGGNVGIGTSTPTSKLTVNGTIHSTEVKVTSNLTPDYVFEKYYLGQSSLKPDYTLLTLSEVEEFTKENHHLPNVPSAKEIKENGLHLGEMSNILLQKIEELTLYSIEQEMKNNLQSKEIDALKKEIEYFKTLSERLSKIENQLKK